MFQSFPRIALFFFAIIPILLFHSNTVLAWQQPVDLSELFKKGVQYEQSGDYEQASEIWGQFIEIFENNLGKDDPNVSLALNRQASTLISLAKYSEAKSLILRALSIQETKWGKDDPRLADVLNSLGLVYTELGDDKAAESLYLRSINLLENQKEPNYRLFASCLNNLARLYETQGKYAAAEPRYRRALEIREKELGPYDPDLAYSLNGLGSLYEAQGKYAAAESLFRRSLEIREKKLGPEHILVAVSLNNLGELYRIKKNYKEAESLHQRALQIRQDKLTTDHPLIAISLNYLALVHKEQKKYISAGIFYLRALRIWEKSLGTDHPDVAVCLHNLAFMYKEQGEYASAVPLINRAISIHTLCGVAEGRKSISYKLRAEIAWEEKNRNKAVADLREAIRLAELQRTLFSGGVEDHANAFTSFQSTYELMVAWQSKLGNESEVFSAMERGRAKSLLDQLAASGTDLLAGLPAKEAAVLHQRDLDAKSRLASLEQELRRNDAREDYSSEKKKREDKRLRGEIVRAREELVESYQSIQNASPAYRLAMSKQNEPVGLKQLKTKVASQQGVLLEYLLGNEAGYVLVIRSDGDISVFPLKVNAYQAQKLGIETGPLTLEVMKSILFNEQNTGILDLLKSEKRSDDAAPHLAELWNILIPQELRPSLTNDSIKKLIIIPDGPLSLLPFETLVVENIENDPSYLIDVGPPILYAPSATILYNLSQRHENHFQHHSEKVLSVGNPDYSQKKQSNSSFSTRDSHSTGSHYSLLDNLLSNLPFSLTESNWIVENFQKVGLETVQQLGSKATEANLRRDAAGCKYIHLACHGLTDHAFGNFFGALALTPGNASSSQLNDNGFLTLSEIYELNLKGCELSILSACETNYGPQQMGEGVWSLARGFLVAGSRRVVASSWLVDDEAAANMMSYYSGFISQSEAKDEKPEYVKSLHAAKKWIRGQRKWNSPYYWASFVHIGPEFSISNEGSAKEKKGIILRKSLYDIDYWINICEKYRFVS